MRESSPEVITTFMQQVVVEYHNYGMGHRRSEPREAVAVPVVVQQVDSSLEPLDEPFDAVTRDISTGGIGLFHLREIKSGLIKVTMTAPETHEQMTLLARVEHCTKCGGFYIIGCRFARVLFDADRR
ncbi:MAG: PilZ domain-containing protein [Planctomycetales bacterium]|nr:PilZ domain-containing protein [Planctomycetales bacterium]